MKFSILATTLFAQSIAAMPWYAVKGTKADGEEITVRIQVSGAPNYGSTSKPFKGVNTYPVCLKVCWPEEPKCPEGWGDDDYACWTCCRKERDEDL
ncbi:unnamed protein product [Fusarium venenatum]|uniref:Pathogenicity protein n=1 Tax=Fusarium venenatum TaxID=56646 RepID=A0A2L2T5P5_9HYPO|nr:uncharacterized protein FVRRES_02646 [Fusarium venenatum]CEI66134.1 unnamed protein product [Fusarium venenatum]